MIKLKKYKFNELYQMSSGISSKPEQAGHGAPFVSFRTVFNNYFLPDELPDLMDTSVKEQQMYSIKKGDVLMTRTSETLDELGMSCIAVKDYPEATYSGFLKRLRPITEGIVYEKYMAFYLRSKLFRKTMTNNAIMTLRASFNEDIFSYLNLYLPDYESQKSIGDFLFLIESKIKLNNRINAELEAMAKTIYDYWFVQFDFPNAEGKPYRSSGGNMVWSEELKIEIPERWEVKKLEDVVSKTGTGLNPRDNFVLAQGENYYVTIKNIEQGKVVLDNKCDKISNESLEIINKRSDLRVGDILFTSIEPVGVTYLILEKPKNWNINESVFTIRPNFDKVTSEFLYMFLSGDYIKSYTKNVAAGSIHKGVRHSVLKECKFILPSRNIIDNFSSILHPILKQQDLIQQENQKLSSLRDWLLPMLMNGQVKVGSGYEGEVESLMAAEAGVGYWEK